MFQIQDYEDLFLYVYCFVDDALKEMVQEMGIQLKTRCSLSVSEILTIQIVGEFMEKKTETAIYQLMREYKNLFNAVHSRSSFYKQLKKYAFLLEHLLVALGEEFGSEDNVLIPDGFPIPIKKMVRKNAGVNIGGRAQVGYCASLEEYFYGLKGHILVNSRGFIKKLILAPAAPHDVKFLKVLLEDEHDKIVICDKGYISHELTEIEAQQHNTILTEKRKNQIGYKEHNKALRPQMKKRKIVETIISHLERMSSKAMKQRAFWVIKLRMLSKCIAIGSSISYNLEYGLDRLLRMKNLRPVFL